MAAENLAPTEIRSPDRVAIPTELSRPTIRRNYNNIIGKIEEMLIFYLINNYIITSEKE
jgi:hypothetical protein